MTTRRKWQVWTEPEPTPEAPSPDDVVLFEGTEAQCKAYYKRKGGSKAGLHVGYLIPEDTDDATI